MCMETITAGGSGIGFAWSDSSRAQVWKSSGLLAAMCHEHRGPPATLTVHLRQA